jgi:hypothetical protein
VAVELEVVVGSEVEVVVEPDAKEEEEAIAAACMSL